MNVDLIQIVFSFISLVLVSFIVPYVKLKLNQEQLKTINTWADMAVKAVEQMPEFRNKTGEEKKAFVVNFLTHRGIQLSPEELNTIIESSVNMLKTSKALLMTK